MNRSLSYHAEFRLLPPGDRELEALLTQAVQLTLALLDSPLLPISELAPPICKKRFRRSDSQALQAARDKHTSLRCVNP